MNTTQQDRAFLKQLVVLHVEDEAVIRKSLDKQLRNHVGRLLTAKDGAEGLELFRTQRPQIVVADIQMPVMDGLAMAQEMRALDPQVHIIISSAFEIPEYLLRSIEIGIDKFVTKPVDSAKLLTVLLACAGKLRTESEHRELSSRLQLATRAGQLGVWDWSIPTNKMSWDDRMLEMYGYTLENFPGCIEAWQQRLHPNDKMQALAESRAALDGLKKYDTEFRISHPDGSVRFIKADGLVLRDETGGPLRMIGMNRDISGRRLLEDAQRFLAACGWSASCEDFFQVLARYLSESLGADFVCIDRLLEGCLAARTLAVYYDGRFEDNIEYALHDTLCGEVVGKQICCYAVSVSTHTFPQR